MSTDDTKFQLGSYHFMMAPGSRQIVINKKRYQIHGGEMIQFWAKTVTNTDGEVEAIILEYTSPDIPIFNEKIVFAPQKEMKLRLKVETDDS